MSRQNKGEDWKDALASFQNLDQGTAGDKWAYASRKSSSRARQQIVQQIKEERQMPKIINEIQTRKQAPKDTPSGGAGESSDQEYEVEGIQDFRVDPALYKLEFWVKWKGYPEEDNTWQSYKQFAEDQPRLVEKFLSVKLQKFQNRQEALRTQLNQALKQIEELRSKEEDTITEVDEDELLVKPSSKIEILQQQQVHTVDILLYSLVKDKENTRNLFEIKLLDKKNQPAKFIDEEQLLNTHSRQMYLHLKNQVQFSQKEADKQQVSDQESEDGDDEEKTPMANRTFRTRKSYSPNGTSRSKSPRSPGSRASERVQESTRVIRRREAEVEEVVIEKYS